VMAYMKDGLLLPDCLSSDCWCNFILWRDPLWGNFVLETFSFPFPFSLGLLVVVVLLVVGVE
jgi:hypothetical protein